VDGLARWSGRRSVGIDARIERHLARVDDDGAPGGVVRAAAHLGDTE
jgi:hypothetical protein